MSIRKKVLSSLLVTLLLATVLILISGCDIFTQFNGNLDSDFFDTIKNETEANEDGSGTVKFTSVCALSLTEYSYTFTVYDENKEVLHEVTSEPITKSISANTEFITEISVPKEIVEKYKYHSFTLTGFSEESPRTLAEQTHKVTYMCMGEEYKTEDVLFGDTITVTWGKEHENLTFTSWYTDPDLTLKADFNGKIYRDKTLYAGYCFNAEKVTNKLTTELMPGLITVMCKKTVGSAPQAYGSGVIFKTEGNQYYALTNYHVLNSGVFYVLDCYGTQFDAYLVAKDATYDLAVIKFRKDVNLEVLDLAEKNPAIGENCISLGYPNLQKNAITYGTVGDYIKSYSTYVSFETIFHDAVVTQGNSGGPLLNADFKIIGINFAKLNDGNDFTYGFAIPIEKVLEFLSKYNISVK